MSTKNVSTEKKGNGVLPLVIHRCKLVPYGNEEKRCVKCGYITWSNNKSDNEIIEDMIKSGYPIPDCDNGV